MKKLILPFIGLLLAACAATPPAEPEEALTGYSGAVLTVHGMSCPLCSNNIDGRLKKVPGIENIQINLETGEVTATFNNERPPTRNQIEIAIKESGFTLNKMELLP